MQRDDPISSSHQEHLIRGESEDESLSYGGIPVASTGIVMLSLPDSPEDHQIESNVFQDNDVFLTPPEESFLAASQEQKTVSTDVRDDRTEELVGDNGDFIDDLGSHVDLEFSADVEVTETIEIDSGSLSSPGVNQLNGNEVIYSDSVDFGESPSKKLKIVEGNSDWRTPELNLGSQAARTIERLTKCIEKLISPSSFLHTDNKLSFKGDSPRVNGTDKEFQGDGSDKRELEFHYEALESRMGENGAVLGVDEERVEEGDTEEIEEESEVEDNEVVSAVNVDMIVVEYEADKIEDDETDGLLTGNEIQSGVNSHGRYENQVTRSIDDIDKFRYVRPSPTGENASGKIKDSGVKRALPVSLLRINSNVQGDSVANGVVSTRDDKKMTIIDVLREVATKYNFDPSLAKMSALEAAKKGGMTFP
ncbi:hypothetical protein M5689_007640 [Euphorbia peplus]|nr:hypothetical protein M5689_007640 [Euphorbia peplus]